MYLNCVRRRHHIRKCPGSAVIINGNLQSVKAHNHLPLPWEFQRKVLFSQMKEMILQDKELSCREAYKRVMNVNNVPTFIQQYHSLTFKHMKRDLLRVQRHAAALPTNADIVHVNHEGNTEAPLFKDTLNKDEDNVGF